MTTRHPDHHLRSSLQRFWAQHKVVYERRQLLDRPWLEDVLHWSPEGELHGRLAPTGASGPRSVTSDGWCPGQR
jgi:hypothetical protein